MPSSPAPEVPLEPESASVPPRRMRWLALVGAIAVAGAGAAWVLWTRETPKPDARSTQVSSAGIARPGEIAPGFVMPNLSGRGDVQFDAGRPTVLTFWASWCAPCRKEFPLLAQAQSENPDLRIFGVVYKDIPADARAFVAEMDVHWENATDAGGDVASAYGVRAIPQVFFVNREGVIVSRVYGLSTRRQLDDELAKIR
ncbi:MAG: TlpA family protein disulfide reductase [Acidimicrobiia bacterium]